MRLSVIIPTLNAAHCIEKLVQALLNQKVVPDEILIVDSQSEDGTACMTAALPKVKLVQIRRSEFDHGGTRDMADRWPTRMQGHLSSLCARSITRKKTGSGVERIFSSWG